jgi:hypothetical protein
MGKKKKVKPPKRDKSFLVESAEEEEGKTSETRQVFPGWRVSPAQINTNSYTEFLDNAGTLATMSVRKALTQLQRSFAPYATARLLPSQTHAVSFYFEIFV